MKKIYVSTISLEEFNRIMRNICKKNDGLFTPKDFKFVPVGYVENGIRPELLGVSSKDKVFVGYFTINEMQYVYAHDKKPNFIGRLKLAIRVLRGKYLKVI